MVTLIAIMFYSQANSQDLGIGFESFENQSKWGLYVAPVYYQKAHSKPKTGEYELKNKNITSFNFGLDYVASPQNEWTFRSGIHLNILPYYNFEYEILDNDLPDTFFAQDRVELKELGQLILSVPLQIEWKKQMGNKLFFSVSSGIELVYLRPGAVSVTYAYIREELQEAREVFAFYAETKKTSIYPNFIIAPGFYFISSKVIFQTSLVYQKPIIGYFKGEYQFGNLDISAPTRGNYKLSGEYFGLGLTLFLKK